MTLADELRKLEDLRLEGVLTEEEFAQAKASLLRSSETRLPESVEEELAELRYEAELAKLEREWLNEREKHVFTSGYLTGRTPTNSDAWLVIGFGLLLVLFGIIIFVFEATQSSRSDETRFLMTPFVIIGALITIGSGLFIRSCAIAYEAAYQRYKQRRRRLHRKDFRI